MYSLIIQEYGQNTEGHICPDSTLSKYGRIQRISEIFQNTAEYRTKYSRIQTIGNCTKLDRKLYPSLDLACCGYTPRINQRRGVWCHPPSADALFVPPWLHGVLKCGSEKGASSTLSDAVDVVDDHVLQKVERAQRIGTVRIESCIIRLIPPPTYLRWERRGDGTSPRGGDPSPPKGGGGGRLGLSGLYFPVHLTLCYA